MTDTQRWGRIAKEFASGVPREGYGLCEAWSVNGGTDNLMSYQTMQDFIDESGGAIFLRPRPSEAGGYEVRATFAALMAAMTKRERAEIGMP